MLGSYQHVIDELTLIPGGGGVFEVMVDDQLIFSKKKTRRHAEPGEVFNTFQHLVGSDVPLYGT